MTPAELAGWIRESRAAQQFPDHVTDEGVLLAVAAMVVARVEGGDVDARSA